MARKTGSKTSDRKFRGFANIVKNLDPEVLKRLALARQRAVERMVKEAYEACGEGEKEKP